VSAELPFVSDVIRDLAPLGLIYACLITTMALTAVFSSKPARRQAALEVLRLLLPGRRDGATTRARARNRAIRRRPDPPDPPPANP
jgi:hypothetical protein